MRIFFTVQKARNTKFVQGSHNLLKAVKSVALRDSPKVLTILVGKAVENESCKFIHSLTVAESIVSLQKDVNNPCKAVVVIGLFSEQRQMNLISLETHFFEFLNLYLELFSEKLTIWFGPKSVFFNFGPQLLILKERFPLRFLG